MLWHVHGSENTDNRPHLSRDAAQLVRSPTDEFRSKVDTMWPQRQKDLIYKVVPDKAKLGIASISFVKISAQLHFPTTLTTSFSSTYSLTEVHHTCQLRLGSTGGINLGGLAQAQREVQQSWCVNTSIQYPGDILSTGWLAGWEISQILYEQWVAAMEG